MMDHGLFNLQELRERIQDAHRRAMYNPGLCFNPQQTPDAFSFGLRNVQQINQPVPLLAGRKDETSTYFSVPDPFPFGYDNSQQVNQPVPFLDGNRDGILNYSAGSSQRLYNGGLHEPIGGGTEKMFPVWERIRWTDEMIKVLITACSYIVEDSPSDVLKNDNSPLLVPIKGKWKAISNAMVERGFLVSPKQCEDKFNDLNKKYKRLNDILGRSNFCDVVEDPSLVASMNIPDESKDEAMKILSSRQYFFLEMCSYHNQDRKYIPNDEGLRRSVLMALRGKGKYGFVDASIGIPVKRQKRACSDSSPTFELDDGSVNVLSEDVEGLELKNQGRMVQLEEKRMEIEREMVELERKKIEWLRVCRMEDRELCRMKMENELLKLENKRLASELKFRERRYFEG